MRASFLRKSQSQLTRVIAVAVKNRHISRVERSLRRILARPTLEDAKRSRDARRWARAAGQFERAFAILSWREDLLIQAANCYKELGDFDKAVALYSRVSDAANAAEARFQTGEALRRKGDIPPARAAYRAAGDMGHPLAQGAMLSLDGPRGRFTSLLHSDVEQGRFPRLDVPLTPSTLLERLSAERGDSRRWLGSLDRASHRPATDEGLRWEPHVSFIQVGSLSLEYRGHIEPLLLGVVAIRARIVSERRLVEADVTIAGHIIARETPSLVKRHESGAWLHVVNIWLDCDRILPCRTTLTLTASDQSGHKISEKTVVNITRTPPSFDIPASDAFVRSPVESYDDLTLAVAGQPAQVRSASRTIFAEPVKEVLVMRVDQLGDVSASLPAMKRLRELFPDARLTALVSPALIDIIKSSCLFDDVLGLSLVYDPVSEKRYLDPKEERRIRGLLEEHRFDIAIDLCPADETRPLLKLVDAKYLVGFNPLAWDYIDFGVTVFSRDKVNRIAAISHAAFISTLVEGLGVAMQPSQDVVPRRRDDTLLLEGYKLKRARYVVIHSGARHRINCWPIENYLRLADRIVRELGYRLVFFADEDLSRKTLNAVVSKDDITFAGAMPIDHFDAIIANSRLMIGNDSGPKHLAAARGVDTVSIHIDRLNWREWGQDGQGVIISKRVPCCGCGLNNELMCGKGVICVTSITVDEVFNAVAERLTAEVDVEQGEPVHGDPVDSVVGE